MIEHVKASVRVGPGGKKTVVKAHNRTVKGKGNTTVKRHPRSTKSTAEKAATKSGAGSELEKRKKNPRERYASDGVPLHLPVKPADMGQHEYEMHNAHAQVGGIPTPQQYAHARKMDADAKRTSGSTAAAKKGKVTKQTGLSKPGEVANHASDQSILKMATQNAKGIHKINADRAYKKHVETYGDLSGKRLSKKDSLAAAYGKSRNMDFVKSDGQTAIFKRKSDGGETRISHTLIKPSAEKGRAAALGNMTKDHKRGTNGSTPEKPIKVPTIPGPGAQYASAKGLTHVSFAGGRHQFKDKNGKVTSKTHASVLAALDKTKKGLPDKAEEPFKSPVVKRKPGVSGAPGSSAPKKATSQGPGQTGKIQPKKVAGAKPTKAGSEFAKAKAGIAAKAVKGITNPTKQMKTDKRHLKADDKEYGAPKTLGQQAKIARDTVKVQADTRGKNFFAKAAAGTIRRVMKSPLGVPITNDKTKRTIGASVTAKPIPTKRSKVKRKKA